MTAGLVVKRRRVAEIDRVSHMDTVSRA
jgi:hypothetical protein